ncbi:MAG: NAD(P)-binding domain-containing protein [Oscillospiraceae bacterium]|nr:NAD(P)-binding domain-containing protein [Oscillospiraceae bacterium]
MRIGFIGAGKVGFTLGKFFVEGGVPVTGYWSRQREHMQEAALFTGTKQYDTLAALVNDSDALFLTVTDGAISAMFAQLCTETALSGKQICHCSSAMTAREAFPGLSELGAYGYSIHPLFPISDPYRSWRELTGAFFAWKGTKPILRRGRKC